MATEPAPFPAPIEREANATKSRYFYFCTSLVMAGLVVWGFSHTVDAHLLHANPPRPLLAVVSRLSLLGLDRAVHRTIRSGAGTQGQRPPRTRLASAATVVVSGFIVSVVMLRFDITVLHRKTVASFLSVLWCDMIIFGACMALAIYFRKRPEYHRRLIFMASS